MSKLVCVKGNEVEVLKSNAGYYIGTEEADEDCGGMMMPMCRISQEYWKLEKEAQTALDTNKYTPRHHAGEIQYCNGGKGCQICREQ